MSTINGIFSPSGFYVLSQTKCPLLTVCQNLSTGVDVGLSGQVCAE